jgi:hypothetical protein
LPPTDSGPGDAETSDAQAKDGGRPTDAGKPSDAGHLVPRDAGGVVMGFKVLARQ